MTEDDILNLKYKDFIEEIVTLVFTRTMTGGDAFEGHCIASNIATSIVTSIVLNLKSHEARKGYLGEFMDNVLKTMDPGFEMAGTVDFIRHKGGKLQIKVVKESPDVGPIERK